MRKKFANVKMLPVLPITNWILIIGIGNIGLDPKTLFVCFVYFVVSPSPFVPPVPPVPPH